MGFFYLLAEILILPSLLLSVNRILPHPLSESVLNPLFFLINFLCIVGIFHRFLLESIRQLRTLFRKCLYSAFLAFIGYEAVSYLLGMGIRAMYPDFANLNDAAFHTMAAEHFILLNLSTVLLVPVAEECLFRGLFFQGLYEKNHILAYGVSTVLFSMVHLMGFIGTCDSITLLLCLLQYVPAGLALAWAYDRSGTIIAPMLMHMTVNQLGILSMR